MPIFDKIPLAPPDPLLGLTIAFKNDLRQNKVNLGVGTYKTAELKSCVLNCVKQAEESIIHANKDKEYLPIDGDKEFIKCIQELIYGSELNEGLSSKIAAVQSIGGTGALRIGAEFLSKCGVKKAYISDPTWVNHKPIFSAVGIEVEAYPYYDSTTHGLQFSGFCDFLKKLPPQSLVMLQVVCHNPTGIDPTKDQWREIAAIMQEKEHVPFLDFAYQGFGHGVEEDAFPVRLFANLFEEMLVAYSVSKNFGLYVERVGVLLVHARHESEAVNILSQLKVTVRGNYSSPPSHGSNIVKFIWSNQELRELWRAEVLQMRERICSMRHTLVAGLAARNARLDLEAMAKQVGLFSFIGLGQEQVGHLIAEYGIYLPNNGRINLAGLCANNLEYVLDALMKVIR